MEQHGTQNGTGRKQQADLLRVQKRLLLCCNSAIDRMGPRPSRLIAREGVRPWATRKRLRAFFFRCQLPPIVPLRKDKASLNSNTSEQQPPYAAPALHNTIRTTVRALRLFARRTYRLPHELLNLRDGGRRAKTWAIDVFIRMPRGGCSQQGYHVR